MNDKIRDDASAPPAPVVLVTAALMAATGDGDGANRLLEQNQLSDKPLFLVASMLRLANAFSTYLGGPLTAQPKGSKPLTDDERTILAFADAVWAEEPSRAVQIWNEHVSGLDLDDGAVPRFYGDALTFASGAMLGVYRSDARYIGDATA